MRLVDVKVEYQRNPLGLDVKKPRFSWILESQEQNVYQSDYEILVTQRADNIAVWNSGKVESDQSVLIEYAGNPLLPCTKYDVEVSVTDSDGNIAKEKVSFETGLLSGAGFLGKWITHSFPQDEQACPVFIRECNFEKEIKEVRAYATALGMYEIKVNGKKVGDTYFAPGWTNYKERLQYQTYEVSDFKKGKNKIEITVGDGWYKGILGFACTPNIYGDQVAALAQFHVLYEDGSKEVISTDENWKVKTGTIRSSQLYMGELIDSCYVAEKTYPVAIMDYGYSTIVGQENTPVRVMEKLDVVAYLETPKGEKVLDFGQNMTGFVKVKIKGQKGQKITIRHAETLDKEGNFYPDTLRQAISHDVYILNGEDQTFIPHFTFHGFRYICIEGAAEIIPENYTAFVLYTDMEETGSFWCSDERVNQLQRNIVWGQKGNFLDIPTDCPQRDERLGWTGDAQVFAGTAGYQMDVALFFTKWLRDLKSEQTKEFGVPHVVPDILGPQHGAAAWSDAATIIPWTIYQLYGDQRILAEQYESMKGWVDYITSQTNEAGLWQTGYQYGDWLALDKEESSDRTGATDKYLVANAYYAYSTEIVFNTARILGKEEDALNYQKLHEKIIDLFNAEYITATGRMVSETQTGCVLALHFNLAYEQYKDRILNSLLTNIGNHKDHLSTGFVGTPYLCHTLSDNGHHDLSGTVFLKEDYPSWLYAVNKGATTIWERWNSILPNGDFDESGMNSLNHYAYGSIGDWMYRKLLGINQLEPGYKKILIKPMFIKGITRVKGSLKTVYGTVGCSWICEDGTIKVDVTVPVNTTAILQLPEKKDPITVGSGSYHYEYSTQINLKKDRFTMESTLGYILEQPTAVAILNQYSPEILENPMIQFAYQMTISELKGNMPKEGVELFQMIIDTLNKSN